MIKQLISPFSLLLLTMLLIGTEFVHAQFHPDSLVYLEVQGNDTDPSIVGDGAKKNQVFYNPTATSNNTLLLHMVGTIDNPNGTLLYPSMAANNGFHVISLMYKNWVSGQNACANSVDSDCFLKFRREIIEGIDYSPEINVNSANSVNNRLLKLLQYQAVNNPGQNWDQYYSGSTILWDKIVVSGHSLGGGNAAVIAMTQPVKRVLMFASPNDYSDTLNMVGLWSSQAHVVPDSNYYGFNALYDEADYWIQHDNLLALNLDAFGDTVNVDLEPTPYNNARMLYTKQIVPAGGLADVTHVVMIRDEQTPKDGTGVPVFECVWKYILGIECPTLSIETNNLSKELLIYPNPTSGNIFIDFKQSNFTSLEIEIYNMQGQKLVSKTKLQQNSNQLNMSNFDAGIYFVRIMKDNELIISKKLIKE